MAQRLVEFGYESIVVTSSGAERDERWAPPDGSLLAEVPDSIEVWRVPAAGEPGPATGFRSGAERWLGLEERWSSWWIKRSYLVGLEAGQAAELIYVWMQPYASADVGTALSRALGVPWVADLGDPWALDEMMTYPSALHHRRALRRMGRTLDTASAIVMSTPEAADRLVATLPHLATRPVVAIPNGFDAADFLTPPEPRGDGNFRIVHTGYLHTTLGRQHRRRALVRRSLGGSVRGVDILARSHVFLIEAINRLLGRDPALTDILELHLAGVMDEADLDVARLCPVAKLRGYMTHAESVALMRSADLLFLPMQNLPDAVRSTIVPGKTYEYLASGRPILAAVPEGDARDILTEAGGSIIVRPDDIEGMAEALDREIRRFRAGGEGPRRDPDVIARFEYRKLAGDLAGVFDDVLACQRTFAPAAR